MPIAIYKNDGSGRDSYINECMKTDKGKKAAASGGSFWPNPVEEHQNRRREAKNNVPLSPTEKRREYGNFLPTVPVKSSHDIQAQYTPRRNLHSPNLDITSPRQSPSTARGVGGSPANSLGGSLNLSTGSLTARGQGSVSPPRGGGPINNFRNHFMESTAHKTQREGRFNVASEAPANPDILPAIRARARPGVGQYA